MRHTWLLLLTFMVGLCFWVVWYLPASVVAGYAEPALNKQGIALQLSNPQGTAWNGSTEWRWQQLSGVATWQLKWQGIAPAMQLRLESGEATFTGVVSGGSQSLSLTDSRFLLPLPVVFEGQQDVSATGNVNGRINLFRWANQQVIDLDGQLFYEGGAGQWQQERAQLPALFARLYMDQGQAIADVLDESDTPLAKATLDQAGLARLELYRTFAKAIGQSQGAGNDTDVIFKIGQKIL